MKFTLTGALLAATALTSAPAFADEVIFAHGANPGNPRYAAAEMFADLVPACTGGETTVNVAASATMGNDVEMLTSVAGDRGRPRNYTYGSAKSATTTYLEGMRSRYGLGRRRRHPDVGQQPGPAGADRARGRDAWPAVPVRGPADRVERARR